MNAPMLQKSPPALPDWLTVPTTPTLTFSILPDVLAQSIEQQSASWQQLAAMLASPPTYPSKAACPLIKLATFGTTRSEKGSLRHDGNMLTVTGVEGDYDGEQVPMAVAVERARSAGIAAVFYTSASHTPAKPRWRVLCPLSASVLPAERERLLARVDALLGGILADESYTLSQTYFYGRVAGAPFESVVVDGVPFDTVLPPAERIIKPTKGKAPTRTLPIPADIDEVLARIDPKGDYTETWSPTVLGTLNTFGAAAVPHLVKWSQPWYAANSWTEARAIADIAGRLQETGTATWENVRERAGLPRPDLKDTFKPVPDYEQSKQQSGGGSVSVQLIKASDVPPENVDWLWKHWLAKGKIHIAAGAPGTGKTTIALRLSAIVSNGGTFPDGYACEAGNVLIWSGEDAIADTLVPRLMAAGANMGRVFFVNDIGQGENRIAFDPAIHMTELEIAARMLGNVSLLIVDSIADVIAGDSHKNAEVRRGLRPLADFGQQTGCAIFGIAHFNKGSGGKDPLERVMGSAAFGAVARVVYGCAKIVENDILIRRVFARAKSNIGPDGDGFEYGIHMLTMENGIEASRVEFGQPIIGTAREILSSPDEGGGNPDEGQKMTNAINFLFEILKDGPVDSRVIKAQGKDEFGITMATMRRAKEKLGIVAHQVSKGIWQWSLLPEFSGVKQQ